MKMTKNRLILCLLDATVFFAIYFVVLFIVSGFGRNISINKWLWLALPSEIVFKNVTLILTGSYNRLYRFRSRRDILYIGIVSLLANVLVLTTFLIMYFFDIVPLSMSVLVLSGAFEIAYLSISRIFLGYFVDLLKRKSKKENYNIMKRTLIVGAGSAGQMLFNEILRNSNMGYDVIGFVDDDLGKVGMIYCGKRVYGPISEINDIKIRLNASVIIIAMPSAGKARITSITKIIDYKNTEVLIMPELSKMLTEKISPTLKKISIEDLLGRKTIDLANDTVRNYYKDKTVLITGGGGSIGSEISRQIASFEPKKLVILDIYENCAYELEQELRSKYKCNLDVQVEIVSITNRLALERVFEQHRPNIVIMAAAHKHVPLMEHNIIEAVENNVFGTLNTVELSEKYNVDRVHMVSTDKAVNPTSIMGATKRICEMICQAHSAQKQHTSFSITRFGNVLGSAGSVIPLFKKQIENGGPVTVTDFTIVRYFMTIPEASQLVLISISMAMDGELFILDMGAPVRIYDLALNMVKLSGLEVGKDIEIIETGLRPGEKLFEELSIDKEKLYKTDNELIFIEKYFPLSISELNDSLDKLRNEIVNGNDFSMKEIIKSIVATYIDK